MEYHFSAVAKGTYLHVIGSGMRSLENTRRFLMDTDRARMDSRLDALLLESRFVGGRWNLGGLYSIMLENSDTASLLRRLAWVFTVEETLPEGAEFIELGSVKLGVNCRVFRTIAEAEKWLSE